MSLGRSSVASWLLHLLETFWVLSYLTLWNLTLNPSIPQSLRTNLILLLTPSSLLHSHRCPLGFLPFFLKSHQLRYNLHTVKLNLFGCKVP